MKHKYHLKPLNIEANELARFFQQLESAENLSIEDFFEPRSAAIVDQDGIGHVYISGFIGSGLSKVEKLIGNTDLEDLYDEVATISGQSSKIIMHIDSGGGSAIGNTEAAKALSVLPATLYTHTTTMMASAAYNIGSMGRIVAATPSAMVGSIGTIIPWIDESGLWQAFGLEWQPITNREADLKGAGQGPSLTDAQRDHMQELAQQLFEQFRDNVLSRRRLPDEAIRGQVELGEQAASMNLIDHIEDAESFRQRVIAD